jgi:hypothetical protein
MARRGTPWEDQRGPVGAWQIWPTVADATDDEGQRQLGPPDPRKCEIRRWPELPTNPEDSRVTGQLVQQGFVEITE